MDTNKERYSKELKTLLTQWEMLLNNPNASEEQYSTLRSQIINTCNALDEIEKYEACHV